MIDSDYADELRQDVRRRREDQKQLARHPDPRDPDHPIEDEDQEPDPLAK